MKVLIYETGQTGGTTYPLKDAFETLGYSATIFDWEKYLCSSERPSFVTRVRDRLIFPVVGAKINLDLRAILKGEHYDLVLIVRGDHVHPDTIRLAQNGGTKVATWSSDDIFNPLNNTKCILEAFPLYDRIFSPRGQLRDEYLAKGARSFEMINWYYRPGLLFERPAFTDHQYDYDVGFIGSWSPRRERLLNALEGLNLHIWGWGWDKKTPRDFFARGNLHNSVSMTDMMAIFSRTKINLNILTHENRDATNFRNFEIPAAGAFQLSERSNEVVDLFAEGAEIACFDSGEELRTVCEKYLRKDATREVVAAAGYNRLVSGHHSIVDRARQIAAWVQKE
jgi:spore maturation protein CgeB